MTRWRTPFDRYSISKGGSAQVVYYDDLPLDEHWPRVIELFGFTGQPDIVMTRE